MLGFRKIKGIDTLYLKNKFNKDFEEVFNTPLLKYLKKGFIIKENDTYRLSDKGIKVSNSILCDFLCKFFH